ncbi:hypothetical protein AC578_1653 [Pseudocercospora eumusae]|uniref:Uncharacterized protein n=1 Tax=Pseudocercospora eumusae TaxID=321146 RepID=A0A139HLP2_9PEZI|nr:hypothetical protein AC578_1653 [Pseudocercospora eumusae]
MHPKRTKGKQKSTALPPTASSQCAASRVFGIPELLGDILIKCAAEDVAKSHTALPVKALFVWQRVSCTFRNTIQESPQLRQYMLLERVSTSVAPGVGSLESGNLAVLQNLFGDHHLRRHGRYERLLPDALPKATYDMPTINLDRGIRITRPLSWEKVHLPEAFRMQSATWRNIKLSSEDGGMRIRQWVTNDRLSSDTIPFISASADFGYICDVVSKHEMKLGDLVKVVAELHARTHKEHIAKFICFFVGEGSYQHWVPRVRQLRSEDGHDLLPDQNIVNHVEVIEIGKMPVDTNAE